MRGTINGVRFGVCGALLWTVLLAACAPIADPSTGLPAEEAAALIEATPRSDRTPEELAEAFALNSRATDVQRDMLTTDVVGHAVEWDVSVYDVEYADGRFTVTSQPFPITDTEAAPLLRVIASIVPQNQADDTLLRAVKTDEVIRVRGIVQKIQLRTIVAITPATLVANADPSD